MAKMGKSYISKLAIVLVLMAAISIPGEKTKS